MTAFLIVAAAMLVVACAWVVVPLVRHHAPPAESRENRNLAILRDQRAELEIDLATGVVAADQCEASRLELQRRVLEETVDTPSAVAAARPDAWTAVIVAVALPIAAVLLYVLLGAPLALDPDASPAASREAVPREQVDTLIARVKERLAQEPDNLEGWTVLARAYLALGRVQEAAAAFEQATRLAPNDASLLADHADAIGIAQGRSLEGAPAALIERALKADPAHLKANALAGTLAFTRKQYAQAAEHWERVKARVPADSPLAQAIEGTLAEARRLGGSAATTPSRGEQAIAGTVQIAPALVAGLNPDDAVFVFARAAAGSRMPLAIVRKQVKDLPLAFTLDDSMAMSPAAKLSDQSEVVVVARVSKSGSATPQSGDLETTSAPVKPGASGLKLVIDRRIP